MIATNSKSRRLFRVIVASWLLATIAACQTGEVQSPERSRRYLESVSICKDFFRKEFYAATIGLESGLSEDGFAEKVDASIKGETDEYLQSVASRVAQIRDANPSVPSTHSSWAKVSETMTQEFLRITDCRSLPEYVGMDIMRNELRLAFLSRAGEIVNSSIDTSSAHQVGEHLLATLIRARINRITSRKVE